eukprot:GHVN01033358.1.p2 GENE.GHVN01033358.1~~GHVN01033358.1.p2  ORF type:complete len:202 (-),score=57.76 GHVN01033358.1:139-744(-)
METQKQVLKSVINDLSDKVGLINADGAARLKQAKSLGEVKAIIEEIETPDHDEEEGVSDEGEAALDEEGDGEKFVDTASLRREVREVMGGVNQLARLEAEDKRRFKGGPVESDDSNSLGVLLSDVGMFHDSGGGRVRLTDPNTKPLVEIRGTGKDDELVGFFKNDNLFGPDGKGREGLGAGSGWASLLGGDGMGDENVNGE